MPLHLHAEFVDLADLVQFTNSASLLFRTVKLLRLLGTPQVLLTISCPVANICLFFRRCIIVKTGIGIIVGARVGVRI